MSTRGCNLGSGPTLTQTVDQWKSKILVMSIVWFIVHHLREFYIPFTLQELQTIYVVPMKSNILPRATDLQALTINYSSINMIQNLKEHKKDRLLCKADRKCLLIPDTQHTHKQMLQKSPVSGFTFFPIA